VEQGKRAMIVPTDDVTAVRGPRPRGAPGPWSRRVRTVSLPFPTPNVALEATGHSAGFFPVCGSVLVARASAWALDTMSRESR
jgi:hypothetical protein